MEDNVKIIAEKLEAAKGEDSFDISMSQAELENLPVDFMNLESKIEEAPIEKKKAKKINISELHVLEKNELDKERAIRQALYGNKSLFMVVAAQSGYTAKLVPLVHKDSVNIMYSHLSRYEYKKALFKVIHEKIYDTCVGRMSFEEWLRCTSVEDVETFYYGLYCATFPNEGSFSMTCPSCKESTDINVNHRNLFTTSDKEKMQTLMKNVSKNVSNKEDMKNYSLIGKNDAFELSDSGIIAELRTPSLYDSLELLKSVPEAIIDKDPVGLTNMLYINQLFIKDKNDDGYVAITDRDTLLKTIENLTIDDAAELEEAVSDRVDDNRITYSIKNATCPHCGKVIDSIPISVEDILFTLIFEKTQ